LRASGPDAEAIADAENMTKDEQNEMIASMVQRLRDRLADEPDDTDGWLRLARAYDVLGQTENTMEALAKAAKSAPNDLDIQLNFLEQILSTGSTTLNIERAKETLATAAKISPNNPQILFFKGHLARISGDKKDARDAWKALLDIMEPGSDAARALAKEIELIN
jgi:cytochrome c-type biogenesis protein CcmH